MKKFTQKTKKSSFPLPVLVVSPADAQQTGLLDIGAFCPGDKPDAPGTLTIAEDSGPIEVLLPDFLADFVANWDGKYVLCIRDDVPVEVVDLIKNISADQGAVCIHSMVY